MSGDVQATDFARDGSPLIATAKDWSLMADALKLTLAERDEARARLAAVEAVLNSGQHGGYWAKGQGGWTRGVDETAIRAALSQPHQPPVSGGDEA